VLEKEVTLSRTILEQELGRPITLFSFPYGRHWTDCRRKFPDARLLFEEAGYLAACTTRWGRFNILKDLFALRRIGIWPSDTQLDFKQKLAGHYDWLAGKEDAVRSIRRLVSGLRYSDNSRVNPPKS
jgi:hypothetical protein